MKGSGLANTCPVLGTGSSNLKDLKSGTYKLERFCMEPTSFSVKEESQFKGGETSFASTKLMTRLTYTLDGVRASVCARARAHAHPLCLRCPRILQILGPKTAHTGAHSPQNQRARLPRPNGYQMTGMFKVDGSGNVELKEDDGIDYAPVTVQVGAPGRQTPAALSCASATLLHASNAEERISPPSLKRSAPPPSHPLVTAAGRRRARAVPVLHQAAQRQGPRRRVWRRLCGAQLPRLHLPGPQGGDAQGGRGSGVRKGCEWGGEPRCQRPACGSLTLTY